MITYQKYNEILKKQRIKTDALSSLIYNRGEEKMTEPIAQELSQILIGLKEGNYNSAHLNNFCKENLGIEKRVLIQRDFSRLNKSN
jgi:hypothetical protein